MKWDVFISHASEDKDTVAKPLAQILEGFGLSVWLDENELSIGDSLIDSINNGIANSKYAVIILSHSFLTKKWPKSELNAFFSQEKLNHKKILPVWHKITHDEVSELSPLMLDRLYVSTDKGFNEISRSIVKSINSKEKALKKTNKEETIKGEVKFITEDKVRKMLKSIWTLILTFIFIMISSLGYVVLGESENHSFYQNYISSILITIELIIIFIVFSKGLQVYSINKLTHDGKYAEIKYNTDYRVKRPFQFLVSNLNRKYKYITVSIFVVVLFISVVYLLTGYFLIVMAFMKNEMALSYLNEKNYIIHSLLVLSSVSAYFTTSNLYSIYKINKNNIFFNKETSIKLIFLIPLVLSLLVSIYILTTNYFSSLENNVVSSTSLKKLINESLSITQDEKKHWIEILPTLDQKHIIKLSAVLTDEKKKIDELLKPSIGLTFLDYEDDKNPYKNNSNYPVGIIAVNTEVGSTAHDVKIPRCAIITNVYGKEVEKIEDVIIALRKYNSDAKIEYWFAGKINVAIAPPKLLGSYRRPNKPVKFTIKEDFNPNECI